MNADGKSDGFVVPSTQTNNAGAEPAAESAEGRDSAKRNTNENGLYRTPSRNKRRSFGLAGVREAARLNPELKFTALLHHVNEDLLTSAFFDLKKTAAVGVDEVTWQDYEQDLEERITDLHGRIHRGAYRAKPSLATWSGVHQSWADASQWVRPNTVRHGICALILHQNWHGTCARQCDSAGSPPN